MTDAMQIKEKIISLVKLNGPSLPVFIARGTGLSILFASAFLSELFGDKELKMSDLRVGNSPLYFLPGQEPMLENFSQYLKNKEKEAFLLLKEKKFLKDVELEPAIRVALRQIKDFAMPFHRDNEIFWRYFLADESEFTLKVKPVVNREPEKEVMINETLVSGEIPIYEKKEVTEIEISNEKETDGTQEELPEQFDKKETKKHEKKEKKPAQKIKKKTKDENNRFFNRVKEFLLKKKIEILGIEEININKIIFRVKEKEEYLIIAYNKKKITDVDIINSYKKAKDLKLPYKILSLGETMKKLDSLIRASKELRGIEKVE